MPMKKFKKCVVPSCGNSNENTDKIFVRFPSDSSRREDWCAAIHYYHKECLSSNNYICEDHFELEKDVMNWMYYKTMGGFLKIKPGIVPHKNIERIPKVDAPALLDKSETKREFEESSTISHQHSDFGEKMDVHQKEIQVNKIDEKVTIKVEDRVGCSKDFSLETVNIKQEKIENESEVEAFYENIQPEIVTVSQIKKELIKDEDISDYPEDISVEQLECKKDLVKVETDEFSQEELAIKAGDCTGSSEDVLMETIRCHEDQIENELIKVEDNPVVIKPEMIGETELVELMSIQEDVNPDLPSSESKSVKTEDKIKEGKPSRAQKGTLKCRFCPKTYADAPALKRHERRIHREERPHKCRFCSKCFTIESILARHERFHTKEKPFHCKYCSKSFSQKCDLLDHERVHTGEKPFKCPTCSKCFAKQTTLATHQKRHKDEKKPFQCESCPQAFLYKSSLVYHQRDHTGEKPFQCKVCPKSFSHNYSLSRHERVHTKETPFQCTVCLRSFGQNSYLLLHMKKHHGDKSYLCKVCLKSFIYKSALITHEKLHEVEEEEEKSFQCNVCLEIFSRNSKLKLHQRYHTPSKNSLDPNRDEQSEKRPNISIVETEKDVDAPRNIKTETDT